MHSVTQLFNRRTIVALASGLFVSLPASADDLDVYTSTLSGQVKPNILLVLDYSGSMNETVDGKSKISILKGAVKDLMVDHEHRIRLGLGSLYDSTPSGVRWPIAELAADPNSVDTDIPPDTYKMSDIIESQLDRRGAGGSTNTVGALADSVMYFRGAPVTHNDGSLTNAWNHKPDSWQDSDERYNYGNADAALPASYTPPDAYKTLDSLGTLTSWCRDYTHFDPLAENQCLGKAVSSCSIVDPYTSNVGADENGNGGTPTPRPGYKSCEYTTFDSWEQPTYTSPITHECQKNFMILISDGRPTSRSTGLTLDTVLSAPGTPYPAAGTPHNACLDVSTSIFGDSEKTYGNCGLEILHNLATQDQVPGIEGSTVTTYTVGFSIGDSGGTYLDELAKAGQGKFFQANNKAELNDALSKLLDDILKGSENFAELSIDLDKASFSHDNRAYFSLFNPSTRRAWDGNLKGYYLTENGLVDVNNNPAIISDETGIRFDENAQSFWSASTDGNEVVLGGASEQIIAGSRNLYTFTGNSISVLGEDLTSTTNALETGNSYLTDSMLNDPADRDALLSWLETAPMGDPLHSKVVSVKYENKKVAFAITNQGFLHAIDATKPEDPATPDTSGGEELFAFMPQELLSNLPDIKTNGPSLNGEHIYGLDGQITPIHKDINGNGIVEPGEGDKLLLVFGMRRGGTSYYAVDVTNYNSPKLMWQIKGGVGDFDRLAQTWSRMSLITARNDADTGTEQVLVFAGGYDAEKVDDTDGKKDAKGNAIYMVDLNGNHIWSVDKDDEGDMKYSIPSDITIIDIDADGVADRMYVGDTGSQVWRVKFGNVRGGEFDVERFANLHNGDNQPLFYQPSVAMNRSAAGDFLSVSLASGNRTDPLQADSQHAIYMLRDEDLNKGAPDTPFDRIDHADLFNATPNEVASSDPDTATAAKDLLASRKGWYIALATGEKGLSATLSFEGNLLATTYEPSTATGDSVCDFVSTGKLYIMDLKDGRPVKYLSDGTAITDGLLASDRITPLNGSSIPSSPLIAFPKGSSQVSIIVDKETLSTISQRLARVFWHAK